MAVFAAFYPMLQCKGYMYSGLRDSEDSETPLTKSSKLQTSLYEPNRTLYIHTYVHTYIYYPWNEDTSTARTVFSIHGFFQAPVLCPARKLLSYDYSCSLAYHFNWLFCNHGLTYIRWSVWWRSSVSLLLNSLLYYCIICRGGRNIGHCSWHCVAIFPLCNDKDISYLRTLLEIWKSEQNMLKWSDPKLQCWRICPTTIKFVINFQPRRINDSCMWKEHFGTETVCTYLSFVGRLSSQA
jgi:hypothetical protein